MIGDDDDDTVEQCWVAGESAVTDEGSESADTASCCLHRIAGTNTGHCHTSQASLYTAEFVEFVTVMLWVMFALWLSLPSLRGR